MNAVFLCVGNSCRSLPAEATLNHLVSAGWGALSADNKPVERAHSHSLAPLVSKSISTKGYHSKLWGDLSLTLVVVAVAHSGAAGETALLQLSPAHPRWGVEDPAHAASTGLEANTPPPARLRNGHAGLEVSLHRISIPFS